MIVPCATWIVFNDTFVSTRSSHADIWCRVDPLKTQIGSYPVMWRNRG